MENSQVNDFKIVKPANLERKHKEQVIADIGANGKFSKVGKEMTVENLTELNNRIEDEKKHPEIVPGLLVPRNGIAVSTVKKVVAQVKDMPKVGEVKDGYAQIFPNFTGKKFIGGKNYSFERGNGVVVPKDVKDILERGKKLLYV